MPSSAGRWNTHSSRSLLTLVCCNTPPALPVFGNTTFSSTWGSDALVAVSLARAQGTGTLHSAYMKGEGWSVKSSGTHFRDFVLQRWPSPGSDVTVPMAEAAKWASLLMESEPRGSWGLGRSHPGPQIPFPSPGQQWELPKLWEQSQLPKARTGYGYVTAMCNHGMATTGFGVPKHWC